MHLLERGQWQARQVFTCRNDSIRPQLCNTYTSRFPVKCRGFPPSAKWGNRTNLGNGAQLHLHVACVSTGSWPDTWSPQQESAQPGWLGKEWFACLNGRDREGMVSLLSSDCYFESLALQETFRGPQAISHLLDMLLRNLSGDVQHVVECVTGGQSSALAVLWRVTGGQSSLLHAKGITFMKVNSQDQICYIRDAPEHPIKALLQAAPMANLATSMLASVPAFWATGAGSSMQQSQIEAFAPTAQNTGQDLNQWGSTTVNSQPPQERPSSVAQLQAELQRAKGERDALEARLKLLLQTRRTAGNNSAAAEASSAAAQLQSTMGTPGRGPQNRENASRQTYSPLSSRPNSASTGSIKASGQREALQTESMQNLSGVWIKDTSRSDQAAYGRALDLMQLNGLQKTTALRLIEGVEIQQDADTFSVNFLTVVPFFKVTEQYSFSRQTSMARRDLRSGRQTAQAMLNPEGVRLSINWGEPNAARVEDLYRMRAPDDLEVVSNVSVGGQIEITTQVYKRQERWRPRFTWSGGLFG